MGADERWLAAVWEFVRNHLPPPPAAVLEVGCGPFGGVVPTLRSAGYNAIGVDPQAPEGPGFQLIEFEGYQPPRPVDVVVASTSLHHVADLDEVLDKIVATLRPDGEIVVVEWAWERIDEATATWGFERLGRSTEPSWLGKRREEWLATGGSWENYFVAWAHAEGLHPSDQICAGLDSRFERLSLSHGAYFFPDLPDVQEADELAAIDSGVIRATSTRYVGRLR